LQVVVMVRLDIAFVVELELRLQVGEVANFFTEWTPGVAAPQPAAGLVDAGAAAPPPWCGLVYFPYLPLFAL
jgi:hypothetical protein